MSAAIFSYLRAHGANCVRVLGLTVTLAFKSLLLVRGLVGVTLRQWRILRVPQSQRPSMNGPLVLQRDDRANLHSLDVFAFCMSSCWHGHATAGLAWARGKKTQQWLVGQVHPYPVVPAVQSRQPHILRHFIHCPHLSSLSALELCFAAAIIPFAFWVCADAVHLFTQQL